MAPSTTARPRSTARTARPAPVPASPPSTSTPSWPPPSWRPGTPHVVPLAPEFIGPQDGHDKQDCESRAVRRWLARHGPGLARLDPVYLGDDLYACQPVCEAVLAQGGHFLFTCKP